MVRVASILMVLKLELELLQYNLLERRGLQSKQALGRSHCQTLMGQHCCLTHQL